MDPIVLAMIITGIKEGADILLRLQAGDPTAEQQALDWLGVTGTVEDAIANWEASKKPA